MTKNEKIGVGIAFTGAMALNTVVTFRYATIRQFKIDQAEMDSAFQKFVDNDLAAIIEAERAAERELLENEEAAEKARNKPSILEMMRSTTSDERVNLDPLFEAVENNTMEEGEKND